MGKGDGEKEAKRRRSRSSKRSRDASPSSVSGSSRSPSSASSPSRSPESWSRRSSKRKKSSSSSSSRRHRHHHKSSSRSRSSRDDDRRRHRRRRRDESSGSEDSDRAEEAREIVRDILSEFPAVAGELGQLLQMIDSGEGIDVSGIADKPLVKHLKKLFKTLKLKESANGAYLLPPKCVPTLHVVGPVLLANAKLGDDQNRYLSSQNRQELPSSNFDVQNKNDILPEEAGKVYSEQEPPKKRFCPMHGNWSCNAIT